MIEERRAEACKVEVWDVKAGDESREGSWEDIKLEGSTEGSSQVRPLLSKVKESPSRPL